MNEEKRKILKMLAEGAIGAEEAATLIDALEHGEAEEAARAQPRSEARKLRIRIEEASGKEFNVSVPLGLVRLARRLVPSELAARVGEGGFDLEAILEAAEGGADGEILRMEEASGAEIVITVE